MAGSYAKFVGTTDRHTNWTSEVILERDEETDEPTKVVRLGEPISLTAEERTRLEDEIGLVFEDSSADEAKAFHKAVAEAPQVGADVATASPVFGNAEAPAQGRRGADSTSNDK